MIRGFLSGVIWGSVVSVLGLGAVSQLTRLPVERIAADASAVPRAKPAVVDAVVAPEAVAPAPDAAAPVETKVAKPEPVVEPAGPLTEALDPPAGSEFAKPLPEVDAVLPAVDAAQAPQVVAPLTQPNADVATTTKEPSVAPSTGLEAPKPLDVPDETADAGAPALPGEGEQIALAVPGQLPLPQLDAAPLPAQDPAPPAKAEPKEVLLKPLPEILPLPEAPAEPSVQLTPDPALVPDAVPKADPAPTESATLAPTPELKGTVDGVTIGRLPRIGDAPPAAEDEALPAAEANPEAAPDVVIDGEAELPPLQKYARVFENPDAKPLFSIILIDTGGADVDRAALAAMPFPVTFALDPSAPNAAEASKIYRAAGQEVIMVATGIPPGATASDLEVTFGSHALALPEAVAVIDTEFGAFQADRPLATQVVPILKAQGRGLISWDRGLNAADQVARREGLPAGMVFRKLDGKGENKSAVRRALDRAAFKAVQDGRVMVIGQTLPETVAALMEWAVEGRAETVALAPVSAVLTVQ